MTQRVTPQGATRAAGRISRTSGTVLFAVLMVLSFFCVAAMVVALSYAHRITEGNATAQFQALAGTTDVVIVNHTPLNYGPGGNPHHAVFNLRVQGQLVTGECTSSISSDPVCSFLTNFAGS